MMTASREEGRKYVEKALSKYPVVLFGRAACPACVSAKSNLGRTATPARVKYIYLEEIGSMQYSVSSFLQSSTGRNASPFIFIGGEFVGNNVDVRGLMTSGKLKPMIQKADENHSKAKEEEQLSYPGSAA